MKNELFITTRSRVKANPKVIQSSTLEVRHYPKGRGTSSATNSIAIDVVDSQGPIEAEKIFIKFFTGMVWQGTFAQLQQCLSKESMYHSTPELG